MRYLGVLILLLVFSVYGFSQTGTVRGIVKNGDDGNAVPFAKVMLLGADKNAMTDGDGLFSIPQVPAGKYTLRVTSTGFTEYSKEI